MRLRRAIVAAAALGAAAASSPVLSQTRPASAVLDVPFVPQADERCGGAAAAMAMRYWGARGVYASTFAPLVDRKARGIQTSALVSDLRRREWIAVAGAGDMSGLGKELARGRPVIALVEDRPGRFHYLVVVAAADDDVVVHDPARAPSRRVAAARFDAAWSRSGRWMLVLLPGPGLRSEDGSPGSVEWR